MDGELGIVVEPEYLPEDLYPFSLVEDTDLNIRGSCLSYFSRSRIGNEWNCDSLHINIIVNVTNTFWGILLLITC